MFYIKNVPLWERSIRVMVGIALLGSGFLLLERNASLAYWFMGVGVVAVLTGFFGFCPMCALLGRKLES